MYISVDIEGVAGITNWNEAEKNHPEWHEFREIMTLEAAAAAKGAKAAGATEIWIKDAHDSGRNLLLSLLPDDVTVIRDWSGHPFSMLQELDESFDALLMIGYHAGVGSDGNALAHTLNTQTHAMLLNGEPLSEFRLNALAAASLGVPTVFVSGDKALGEEVSRYSPSTTYVTLKEGRGRSTISVTPARARAAIEQGVKQALGKKPLAQKMPLPKSFVLELSYVDPVTAYARSFYPGCKMVGPRQNRFETDNIFDVARALRFIK